MSSTQKYATIVHEVNILMEVYRYGYEKLQRQGEW
jgi:hypothetical protein